MKTEHAIRALAGTDRLISILLWDSVSQWRLLLRVLAGGHLMQPAFAGSCRAESTSNRCGSRKGGGSCYR